MQKIWTTIRHNQGLCIGLIIIVCVLSWTFGCESKCRSLRDPTSRVNRSGLQHELDTLIAEAEMRFIDLNRQDEFKRTLFQTAIAYATEGSINPVAVAITLGNILGLGAIIDNRRKDVHIKTLNAKTENP